MGDEWTTDLGGERQGGLGEDHRFPAARRLPCSIPGAGGQAGPGEGRGDALTTVQREQDVRAAVPQSHGESWIRSRRLETSHRQAQGVSAWLIIQHWVLAIILFYFILFYFIFYFILFYFILFYLFYFILFYFILFYFILFILFYFIFEITF